LFDFGTKVGAFFFLITVSGKLQRLGYLFICFLALQPNASFGLLVSRGFVITRNDTPQSVVLLWTSEQIVS
jgi:hypothetical protein